jgi:hypothetical protein
LTHVSAAAGYGQKLASGSFTVESNGDSPRFQEEIQLFVEIGTTDVRSSAST